MNVEQHGVTVTAPFELRQKLFVVNTHTKQIIECTLDNILLRTYTGMVSNTVLQITYVCTTINGVHKEYTIAGMCGESYFFFNTKEEAKEKLIQLIREEINMNYKYKPSNYVPQVGDIVQAPVSIPEVTTKNKLYVITRVENDRVHYRVD